MKAFAYLYKKTIINFIKDLKNRPLVLVGYIILTFFTLALIAMLIFMPKPDIEVNSGAYAILSSIVTGFLLFIFYNSMKQGLTTGTSIFRMADVNFLFTSPLKPYKVLIYGMIQTALSTFLISFFILFQIGSFRNNFDVPARRFLYIFFIYFLGIFINQIVSMRLYAYFGKNTSVRTKAYKIFKGIVMLLVVGAVIYVFSAQGSKFEALGGLLSSKVFDYIPVIGWLKAVAMLSVNDITPYAIVSMALLVVFVVAILYSFKNISSDFYEDVLASTEKMEKVRSKVKEGKNMDPNSLREQKVKVIKGGGQKGSGASSIFFRQLLEIRKVGIPFVDMRTFWLIIIAVVFGLMGMESPGFVLYMLIYMNFIFGMNSRWSQELDKQYIYLIPASSARRCFFSSLNDVLKCAVDGVIVMSIVAFMFKLDVIQWLLFIAAFVSFGACFIYADMLTRRIFGSNHSKNLSILVKIAISLAVILPGIIIVVGFSIATDMKYTQYIIMILYNLLACLICFMAGRKLFDSFEYLL